MPVEIAAYPDAIATFSEKIDLQDIVFAAHINKLQVEVAAIQATLGTTPQGTDDTVKERLAAVEAASAAVNSNLILVQERAPTVSNPNTGSSTDIQVIDDNLAFTFNAPASGKVLIFLYAGFILPTTSFYRADSNVGIQSTSPSILHFKDIGSTQVNNNLDDRVGSIIYPVIPFYLTGLTVNQAYTFDWIWMATDVSRPGGQALSALYLSGQQNPMTMVWSA